MARAGVRDRRRELPDVGERDAARRLALLLRGLAERPLDRLPDGAEPRLPRPRRRDLARPQRGRDRARRRRSARPSPRSTRCRRRRCPPASSPARSAPGVYTFVGGIGHRRSHGQRRPVVARHQRDPRADAACTTIDTDLGLNAFLRTAGSFVADGFRSARRSRRAASASTAGRFTIASVSATVLVVVERLAPGDATGDGDESLMSRGRVVIAGAVGGNGLTDITINASDEIFVAGGITVSSRSTGVDSGDIRLNAPSVVVGALRGAARARRRRRRRRRAHHGQRDRGQPLRAQPRRRRPRRAADADRDRPRGDAHRPRRPPRGHGDDAQPGAASATTSARCSRSCPPRPTACASCCRSSEPARRGPGALPRRHHERHQRDRRRRGRDLQRAHRHRHLRHRRPSQIAGVFSTAKARIDLVAGSLLDASRDVVHRRARPTRRPRSGRAPSTTSRSRTRTRRPRRSSRWTTARRSSRSATSWPRAHEQRARRPGAGREHRRDRRLGLARQDALARPHVDGARRAHRRRQRHARRRRRDDDLERRDLRGLRRQRLRRPRHDDRGRLTSQRPPRRRSPARSSRPGLLSVDARARATSQRDALVRLGRRGARPERARAGDQRLPRRPRLQLHDRRAHVSTRSAGSRAAVPGLGITIGAAIAIVETENKAAALIDDGADIRATERHGQLDWRRRAASERGVGARRGADRRRSAARSRLREARQPGDVVRRLQHAPRRPAR